MKTKQTVSKPILQTADYIVSSKQVALDQKMVAYDIWATVAHVLMLHKQGIVNLPKAKAILTALLEIEKDEAKGTLIIDPYLGAHLSLEKQIVEKAGDAGYSVHTGRSRNDQVMVTEMLYGKEQMLGVSEKILLVVKVLINLAKEHTATIMPGYTHMQPAKVTTFGQWALAYAYGLLRSWETLKHYYILYDMNPLGSCESYGTSWSLDREFTAKLLGFSKPWEIPQDAISSRGFVQLEYLKALSEMYLVASKITEDLLLFSTFEYGMITLGDSVSQRMHPMTGSSVMAQKKNPDVLEIIRSTAPQIAGYTSIVSGILGSLPMGYNRDTREIKEYMDLGILDTTTMLDAIGKVLKTLQVNKKQMEHLVAINYCMTTDLADYISQSSGIGYRLIYKIVGQVVDKAIQEGKLLHQIKASEIKQKAKSFGISLTLSDSDIQEAINPALAITKRVHVGGSNTEAMKLSITKLEKSLGEAILWTHKQKEVMSQAKTETNKLVKQILEES